jgi:hypothetical protein
MNPSARWTVPAEYEYENLDPSRPLVDTRRTSDWPEIGLIALRAVQSLLSGGTSPLHLAAWQLSCGTDRRAVETIDAVLASSPVDDEARLACAHVLSVASVDESNSLPVYAKLWKKKSFRDHPKRLELGLSLAAAVIPFSEGKALEVLDQVRPRLGDATATEAAMFELVEAVAKIHSHPDESERGIPRAHDLFIREGDAIGMAQCALAEYQRERSLPSSRPAAMLDTLNYAVHQYEVSCRFAWAASTLWFGVVPHLAERMGARAEALAPIFARAADYAERGRSFRQWDSVRHFAGRFGLVARDIGGAWAFEIAKS